MSCLFQSLGKLLGVPHTVLRKKVCDHLQTCTTVAGIPTDVAITERKKYVQNMRNLTCWGGAIEISVVCHLFNTSIKVKSLRSQDKNTSIVFDNQRPTQICVSWNGSHFEPAT